jgi:hypothetical protein
MITDERLELRRGHAAHEAVDALRVGILRGVTATIFDRPTVLAAVAVVALLFALTH